MIVAVTVQPNAERLFAAIIFVGATILHEVAAVNFDGLIYYGSAALLDLVIMILISGIVPTPRMVIKLNLICLVSIIINMVGWVVWLNYLPPTAYNIAFMALYAWTLAVLLKRDKCDVGGFTLDRWYSCIRFDQRARLSYNFFIGGKT